MAIKIFFLADASNPHMIKWIRSLAKEGFEITCFSLPNVNRELYQEYSNVRIYSSDFSINFLKSGHGALRKISYLKTISKIRNLINEIKPDIVHAHYASSYGLLAKLSGSPYLLSVWGSDVYDFPVRSPFHSWLLSNILKGAERIFSTSNVMALQTQKLTNKHIEVIPFGVDIKVFAPHDHEKNDSIFTVGTVKSLEEKYGIEYLIKAYKLVLERTDMPMRLLIVGKGPQEKYLKSLCDELNIQDTTHFTGWIPVEQVPDYHRMLDIAVFPSILDSESFGVAVIEASACEKPVIVTRKGGLVEVVDERKTGLVVEAKKPDALANAILELINNPDLRIQFGKSGREKVLKFYNWNSNLHQMIRAYRSIVR